MKNASVNRIKRLRRLARARLFLRRNGSYVLAGLCFALIAGVLLLAGGQKEKDAPAESSLDERLKDAAASSSPEATRRPAGSTPVPIVPAESPAPTFIPPTTPAPTLMPDMTAHPTALPTEKSPVFEPPVDGRLMRGYAMDCLIWSKTLTQWMTHPGVDISAQTGSEVRAVEAGTVERVYTDDLMGVTVVIRHEGGIETSYMGLAENVPVKEGDRVSSREVIGYIGSTAISECAEEPHLHFEIKVGGEPVDPSGMIVFKREA